MNFKLKIKNNYKKLFFIILCFSLFFSKQWTFIFFSEFNQNLSKNFFRIYVFEVLFFCYFLLGFLINKNFIKSYQQFLLRYKRLILSFLGVILISGFRSYQQGINFLNLIYFIKIFFIGSFLYLYGKSFIEKIKKKESWLKRIFFIESIFIIFQVFLVLGQFIFKKNLYFSLLGENPLNIFLPGVAKINLFGNVFIRGYGTFLHPNITAYIFSIFIIFNYIFFKNKFKKKKYFNQCIHILNIIIFFGIIFTFSKTIYLFWLILGGSLLFLKIKNKKILLNEKFWEISFIFLIIWESLFDHYLITDWQAFLITIILSSFVSKKIVFIKKIIINKLNLSILSYLLINILSVALLYGISIFYYNQTVDDRINIYTKIFQNSSWQSFIFGCPSLKLGACLDIYKNIDIDKVSILMKYNWLDQPIHNCFFLMLYFFGIFGISLLFYGLFKDLKTEKS